ncbi:MAG: hypothetical protein GEU80_01310 [Dehalococcoidia bacterium]|nr:hypothetical protein [Dehalococcoidia bacterium]
MPVGVGPAVQPRRPRHRRGLGRSDTSIGGPCYRAVQAGLRVDELCVAARGDTWRLQGRERPREALSIWGAGVIVNTWTWPGRVPSVAALKVVCLHAQLGSLRTVDTRPLRRVVGVPAGRRLEVLEVTQKIYVGNLPFSSSEEEVENLFAQYGEVVSCSLPIDRETGRPRGFGFVEMSNEDAAKAIEALDGRDFGGRALRVNEARPREAGGSRGGGGGYGGGGGGGYGGGGGGGGRGPRRDYDRY